MKRLLTLTLAAGLLGGCSEHIDETQFIESAECPVKVLSVGEVLYDIRIVLIDANGDTYGFNDNGWEDVNPGDTIKHCNE